MKEDKKEIIIKVSQKLFARFGLLKTTVDEIAKLARIGKGTIYHYFTCKEEIFAEVIDKEAQFLKEQIKNAIDGETTAQKKLRAFILTKMKCLKNLANYYSALKDEYLEHYSFIEKARQKNFEEERKIVMAILQDGIDKAIFEVKNPRLTSLAVVSALKGLEYSWTIEDSMVDIEKSLDNLLMVLFKGIEKRN
ncbi:MAG: TetR/AcrR family transcriptional regulator [Desulfobacula sp.]|nr:TetR/AcrR family transcriptional regulator [Desulfobacula sp.]